MLNYQRVSTGHMNQHDQSIHFLCFIFISYRFGGVLGLSKYLQNKEIQPASFLGFRTSRMRFTSLRPSTKHAFPFGHLFKRTSTEKMCMSYIRRVKKPPYLGHNPIVFMFKMCETPFFFEFPVICRKEHIFFMVHTHIISYLSHPKSIFGSSSQPF